MDTENKCVVARVEGGGGHEISKGDLRGTNMHLQKKPRGCTIQQKEHGDIIL